MILVDTETLVALFNLKDNYHTLLKRFKTNT